jgi:hypothetical protein
MRALRFHSNLLATGVVVVLITVPAVSLDSGLAFVGTVYRSVSKTSAYGGCDFELDRSSITDTRFS